MSKGSAPRPMPVGRKTYEDNWEATFGKKCKCAPGDYECGCGKDKCWDCCLQAVKEKAKLDQDISKTKE